jgi:hypothetical protein
MMKPSTDFLTCHNFRCRPGEGRLGSGLYLHHDPKVLGAARLVSTPSSSFLEAWLGIGISRSWKRSPNLSSSTSGVSTEALNFPSPLRLPIPPRELSHFLNHAARNAKANNHHFLLPFTTRAFSAVVCRWCFMARLPSGAKKGLF